MIPSLARARAQPQTPIRKRSVPAIGFASGIGAAEWVVVLVVGTETRRFESGIGWVVMVAVGVDGLDVEAGVGCGRRRD